jgi:riboflavin kinase/FMN adenylyltransferase
LLPKEGIYVSNTLIGDEWLKSVTFLGHRVSTDGNFSIETYVIDRDIESQNGIWIEFLDRIRDNIYFEDMESLKSRISKDIEIARSFR